MFPGKPLTPEHTTPFPPQLSPHEIAASTAPPQPEQKRPVVAVPSEAASPLGSTDPSRSTPGPVAVSSIVEAPAFVPPATAGQDEQSSAVRSASAMPEAAQTPRADKPAEVPAPTKIELPNAETEKPHDPGLRGPQVYIDVVERDPQEALEGDQDVSRSKPALGEVVSAALFEREPVTLSIRSDETGKLQYKAHPSLVPFGAGVRIEGQAATDEAISAGAAHVTATPENTKNVASDATPYWVNIYETRMLPVNPDAPPDERESPGLNIHGLLEKPDVEGPWELVISGEPIDPGYQQEIMQQIEDEIADSHKTMGQQSRARRLEQVAAEAQRSPEGALMRRSVRVGAQTPEAAARIARYVAGSVLPSDGTTQWAEEHEHRQPVVHVGEEAAVVAAQQMTHQAIATLVARKTDMAGLSTLVSPARFRDLIQYPNSQEVSGLPIEDPRTFAVNQVFQEGESVIPVGVITQKGREVNTLYVSEADIIRHQLVIGASGSGKTELVKRLIAEAMIRNPDMQIFVVDFKKKGNYTDPLAKVLLEKGVDSEHAVVTRISPGSDGVLGNINILKPTGNATPEDQALVARDALVASIQEPAAQRVIGKHLYAAIEDAYSSAGFDFKTGKSLYPGVTPDPPDIEQVIKSINKTISSAGFKGDTAGDLGGWSVSQVEDTLRGYAGKLFQSGIGYDIDWAKVRQQKGVIVFEFRDMDEASRKTALTALIRQLGAQLESEKTTSGDYHKAKAMLVLEESGGVLADEKNAEFFTRVRGELGLAMLVAQQGLDDLPADVINNAGSVFAMKQLSTDNLAKLSDRMGNATLDQLRVLNTARAGSGLYFAETTPNGPVQFQIQRNPTHTRQPIEIHGPEEVVDPKYDIQLYEPGIIVEAGRRLKTTATGNDIKAWALANVQLVLEEQPLANASPGLVAELARMTGKEAAIRDKMITNAVISAAKSNPQLQHESSYETFITHVRDDMLAQVAPAYKERDSTPRVDLALNTGRYGRVLSHLNDLTTANRVPVTPEIAAVVGQLGGLSAQEQRDSLTNIESQTLTAAANALHQLTSESIANSPPDATNAPREQVLTDLKKLTGGGDPAFAEKIYAAIEQPVKQAFAARPGQGLGADEQQRAHAIIDEILREARNTPDTGMGYPAIRSALEKAIAAAEAAPGIDLTEFEKLYSTKDAPVTFPPRTRTVIRDGKEVEEIVSAREQIEQIEKMRKEYIEQSAYRAVLADVYFAPDGMDAVIQRFMRQHREQGRVYDELRARLNNGSDPGLGIVDLVASDSPLRQQWERVIASHILYGGARFTMDRQAIQVLRQGYARHVRELRNIAEAQREESSK